MRSAPYGCMKPLPRKPPGCANGSNSAARPGPEVDPARRRPEPAQCRGDASRTALSVAAPRQGWRRPPTRVSQPRAPGRRRSLHIRQSKNVRSPTRAPRTPAPSDALRAFPRGLCRFRHERTVSPMLQRRRRHPADPGVRPRKPAPASTSR